MSEENADSKKRALKRRERTIEMLEADLYNFENGRKSGWETVSRETVYEENSFDFNLTPDWERIKERHKKFSLGFIKEFERSLRNEKNENKIGGGDVK